MVYPNCPLIERSKWDKLIDRITPGPASIHKPKTRQQGVVRECMPCTVAAGIDYATSVSGIEDIKPWDEKILFESVQQSDGGSYMGNCIEAVSSVIEVVYCPTFDHQMSAVLFGFGLLSMMQLYPNFMKPTPWLPAPIGIPDSHGMFGFKPIRRGTQYGIWHLQSYGPSFASEFLNCMVLSEQNLAGGGGSFAITRYKLS